MVLLEAAAAISALAAVLVGNLCAWRIRAGCTCPPPQIRFTRRPPPVKKGFLASLVPHRFGTEAVPTRATPRRLPFFGLGSMKDKFTSWIRTKMSWKLKPSPKFPPLIPHLTKSSLGIRRKAWWHQRRLLW